MLVAAHARLPICGGRGWCTMAIAPVRGHSVGSRSHGHRTDRRRAELPSGLADPNRLPTPAAPAHATTIATAATDATTVAATAADAAATATIAISVPAAVAVAPTTQPRAVASIATRSTADGVVRRYSAHHVGLASLPTAPATLAVASTKQPASPAKQPATPALAVSATK